MTVRLQVLVATVCLAFVAGAATSPSAGAQDTGMDHSAHQHDPAQMQELRDNVPALSGMNDQQLMKLMEFMPGDYEVYVSDAQLRGDVGVLILDHGVNAEEDAVLKERLAPIAKDYPTAIGFGMTMMQSSHLQQAVDELEAAGAKTIVLLPLVTTTYNSMLRQWAYAFGEGDKAAYTSVPQIESSAKIVMAPPFEDDPLFSEIMRDFAMEISTDPANEWVIMVAHGPEDDPDNVWDTANLERHAEWLRANSDFDEVLAINLQDDAPPPVRAANVQKLRAWITVARSRGKEPLILSFVTSRGLEGTINKDLDGLTFRFNPKGLQQHPNFQKWIEQSVAEAAKG